MSHNASAGTTDRARLQRLGLRLEYGTIVWNVGEAALTIGLGVAAGSLALIGFGSDSIIEVFASSVIVWHLRPGHETDRPARTARALRLVGWAFAALATVLSVFAVRDLVTARRPEESLWGAIYLVSAAAVMLGLGLLKHRVAIRLDSAPLRSEATLTMLDAALASGTAVGLGLNIALGWWWADPLTALVVAVICVSEARENLEEAREWATLEEPIVAPPSASTSDALQTLMDRFGLEPLAPANSPVFVLGAGWRSGSTLVQRLVASSGDVLMWGEPYHHSALIRRLSESVLPFSTQWPPRDWIVTSDQIPTADNWIANAFPHPSDLLAGHRALLETMFAVPAARLGFDRWGVKGVRLSGEDAAYLRTILPDARFVFVHRNPYDAFLSYRVWQLMEPPETWWWWHRWPDDRVMTAHRFAEIWLQLVESHIDAAPRLGGLVVAYDDVVDGSAVASIEAVTEVTIDRSVLEQRIGSAHDRVLEPTVLSREDVGAISRVVDPLARQLGYEGPTASVRESGGHP